MDHRPLLQCQQRLLPPATTSDINAVTTLDNLLQSAKPLCGKCGQEVMSSEPSCAQPKSKSGGAFVCNACHARVNLINRTWGASVLDSFKELDDESFSIQPTRNCRQRFTITMLERE